MAEVSATHARSHRVLISALFGAAFGSAFPLVSTVIALLDVEKALNFENALALHKALPLLQVIDTIPLILALAFGLLGRAMGKLDHFIESLEGTVVQRDMVLQKATASAETARKAKGVLLGRFVEQIRTQHANGQIAMRELLNSGMPLDVQRKLKAVATSQQKVHASVWNLEMLAHIDGSCELEEASLCSPQEVFEATAETCSRRVPGGLRYKIVSDAAVPAKVWLAKDSVARTFAALMHCALLKSSRKQLDISISHFAGIHGGVSEIHVAIRNPSTPTVNSVVRSFSDLDPHSAQTAERGELELALCRQLALVHGAKVNLRPDPKGGMCFWMMFPYGENDGHQNPQVGAGETSVNTSLNEMMETAVQAI